MFLSLFVVKPARLGRLTGGPSRKRRSPAKARRAIGSGRPARAALEAAGFVYRHIAGVDLFPDGPDASARDAVHIVFANEFVREGEALPSPDVDECDRAEGFRILRLDALVRVKLTAWRDIDRVHLRDLIEVGLLTPQSITDLPEPLQARLDSLFQPDEPDR